MGDWFEENPRARPLIMLALGAILVLLVGVVIGATRKKKDPLVSDLATPTTISTLAPSSTPIPTGGPEQLGQPAVRLRAGWITEKDVATRISPGLNIPVQGKLQQWDEISWIREEENWDQVRCQDGKEVWIQSKYLVFTKPANLDKPTEAEQAVMAFYQAVARKDYAAAYSFLSGPWKSELDFKTFVEGYSRTVSLRTEISKVIPLSATRYQVEVTMVADEVGQDVPYVGSYVVEKVEDHWDMAEGSLARQAVTPRQLPNDSSTPTATDIPAETPMAPLVTPSPTVEATPPAEGSLPSPTVPPDAPPVPVEPPVPSPSGKPF